MPERPLDLVHGNLDSKVSIMLKDGREIIGILTGYDLELNLTLSNVEIVGNEGTRNLPKIMLRHNNVTSITPISD